MISCLYSTYRHWASHGAVYLISDTHFGDKQCREIDPYWPSPEEHIALLKTRITKNDTVVHLGDVGDPKYMDMLPGFKVLILGNHDRYSDCVWHFDEIFDGPLYITKKLLLSHEPILAYGAMNIHGHVHNGDTTGGAPVYTGDWAGEMNRAANVCGYLPLNLGRAIEDGILSRVRDIHRLTVDNAVMKKKGLIPV